MNIRPMVNEDLPGLQAAIDADHWHPGVWTVEPFCQPNAMTEVVEDSKGPAVYVLFTKTLRISCLWADGDNNSRNARAIMYGMKDAIAKARGSGFTEVIVESEHPPLREFLEKMFGFKPRGEKSKDLMLKI